MTSFFNTLTGKIDEFRPLKPGHVSMYTCGPTVYDFAHIGNFRTFAFEDLLRRYFLSRGYQVKHVMNITDVDDKTIAGAARNHQTLADYTAIYTEAFQVDLKTLNILTPDIEPRATHEIESMIALIQTLIDRGAAYSSDGSVYYRVSSFPDYGKLSKKDLSQNIQGARVDVDEYEKAEGADFVLWKKSKAGEPSWSSPWGPGRPGWHIECSAMSMKYLGETFDLHAGGEDLIFPHHENEIAQSEAATGKPFAHYWLHCRFLLVNGEKMSKSKGNFYTLRDLLGLNLDPMAIRLSLIATHYRSSLNFTLDGVRASENALKDMKAFYSSVFNHEVFGRLLALQDHLSPRIDQSRAQFDEALDDDLNISKALAAFYTFMPEADQALKKGCISRNDWELLKQYLLHVNQILAVVRDQTFDNFQPMIKQLYEKRKALRMEKKFSEADKVRGELMELGAIVWDEPKGLSGVAI